MSGWVSFVCLQGPLPPHVVVDGDMHRAPFTDGSRGVCLLVYVNCLRPVDVGKRSASWF